MMAKTHGKASVVLVDEFDLSSHFNSLEESQEISTAEVTTFGATGSARSYVPGLRSGTLSAQGFFDGAAGAVDVAISADLAAATKRVISASHGAAIAVGGNAKLASADHINHTVSSPVDGAVTTSFSAQCDQGIDTGVWLKTLAATTSTGDGTTVNRGAATSLGWVAHIHCTAVSGTPTLDSELQDSADGNTWADVTGGAFAQLSAAGTERLVSAAGATLRQYVRESHTIGGGTPSLTYTVAVAARPVS